MQPWKTQERITLNLNRITFGNVTACNLDFYRRSAVKGFIPLEKCVGREKLLMLMDFWKLQGLRKLCPLSLLSYALLSITLAIKITLPPANPSFPPSLYRHNRPSGFSTSPFGFSTSCPALFFLPGHVWPTFEPLPVSVCWFTSTCYPPHLLWPRASKFPADCLESAAQVSKRRSRDLCVTLTLMLTAEVSLSV